jgi:hypothetical protein
MVNLVFNLIKIKKNAIFGYNKLVRWYNLFTSWCNLDVGGTQRGTSLIWGYASTKRLRTPELNSLELATLKKVNLLFMLVNNKNYLIFEMFKIVLPLTIVILSGSSDAISKEKEKKTL